LKVSLTTLLSLNAGYVDTAGFLALHGLLAAHVTGNLVIFGAALVLGTSGAIAKLLALPVFCVVIVIARLTSYWLMARHYPVLKTMLWVQVALLACAAVLLACCGPFPAGDRWQAILTGMTLIGAMAIQNAAHRIHLRRAPPTTMMTGNITQAMIDVADMLADGTTETKASTKLQMVTMLKSAVAFATGCAMAATAFGWLGSLCFSLPPVFGLLSLATQYVTVNDGAD
jgi:uncharacterized membrane protein YoaK (UPF0700 family)